jgi:hypothetical protein
MGDSEELLLEKYAKNSASAETCKRHKRSSKIFSPRCEWNVAVAWKVMAGGRLL